jgi:dihydroorotate dehydrogenase
MYIAQMMKAEFPGQGKSLSGIGGVETGNHAAEFLLLGASTVQVRTKPLQQSVNLQNQLSLSEHTSKAAKFILATQLMICLHIYLPWT